MDYAFRSATASQLLAPASVYVLTGRPRTMWQHAIPPVRDERFSLTCRTLRRPPAG